jgi:hypothetical protein
MAIGLHAEGDHDEGEAGIMLQGHLFPLLLGCGSKRRAEDSPGLGILDVNALDIRSYKHIHGEAIIPDADLDFGWFVAFPDELETVPAALSAEAVPASNALAGALDFAVNHAAKTANKRAKRAAARASSSGPESSCSRTSSANTKLSTVHSFLCDSDTPEPRAPSRSPSSMSPEKTTPRAAEAQNWDAAADAAGAEAAAAAEDSKRGVSTRKNPQMQKTARDGQKHWHDKVQEMRIQYDLAHTGLVHPQFAEQRFMCTVRNLKCQKESLLMFLQFALQQRLLTPLPFVHPSDEDSSFLGWTGFQINPGCGPRFRAGVESLFPETPKLNTLYHLFRRSGLVPEDWRRAWEGEIPFLWSPARTS